LDFDPHGRLALLSSCFAVFLATKVVFDDPLDAFLGLAHKGLVAAVVSSAGPKPFTSSHSSKALVARSWDATGYEPAALCSLQ